MSSPSSCDGSCQNCLYLTFNSPMVFHFLVRLLPPGQILIQSPRLQFAPESKPLAPKGKGSSLKHHFWGANSLLVWGRVKHDDFWCYKWPFRIEKKNIISMPPLKFRALVYPRNCIICCTSPPHFSRKILNFPKILSSSRLRAAPMVITNSIPSFERSFLQTSLSNRWLVLLSAPCMKPRWFGISYFLPWKAFLLLLGAVVIHLSPQTHQVHTHQETWKWWVET